MSPRKVLLCKLRSMGDVVIMSASLERARRLFPRAQLSLLIPKLWADLFKEDPRVGRLLLFDTQARGLRKLWEILKISWKLAQIRFDLMMVFHASASAKWVALLGFPRKLVVHNHAFFKTDWPTHAPIPDKNRLRPALERDALCFQALGLPVDKNVGTSLHLTAEERQWAGAEILSRGLKRPLMVISPGASRPTKCWPLEKFADVARAWVQNVRGSVLLVTGPGEDNMAQVFLELTARQPQIQALMNPSLRVAMSILAQADLFLGNDSGPKHVAVALGVPTVTLFGPEDPYEYHPYDTNRHKVVRIPQLACRKNLSPQGDHPWCGIYECVEHRHQCMTDLRVDRVLEAISELRG